MIEQTVENQEFIESSSLPTLEDLSLQFNSLHFFTENLEMQNQDDWYKAKDDPETRAQLILEMLLVNKLKTIEKYYDWTSKTVGEFNKSVFKSRITNKSALTDPFGMIENWGMAMQREGEFELYKELFDTLYKIESV